jgi:hypothetical protein
MIAALVQQRLIERYSLSVRSVMSFEPLLEDEVDKRERFEGIDRLSKEVREGLANFERTSDLAAIYLGVQVKGALSKMEFAGGLISRRHAEFFYSGSSPEMRKETFNLLNLLTLMAPKSRRNRTCRSRCIGMFFYRRYRALVTAGTWLERLRCVSNSASSLRHGK